MDEIINKIGQSPYAVVIGLLLSGIPVYIVLYKFSKNILIFFIGVVKNGIFKQISKTAKLNARTAIRILKIDDMIIFCILGFLDLSQLQQYLLDIR